MAYLHLNVHQLVNLLLSELLATMQRSRFSDWDNLDGIHFLRTSGESLLSDRSSKAESLLSMFRTVRSIETKYQV